MLGVPVDETVPGEIDHQLLDSAAINEGAYRSEDLCGGNGSGIVDKLDDWIKAFAPQPGRYFAGTSRSGPQRAKITCAVNAYDNGGPLRWSGLRVATESSDRRCKQNETPPSHMRTPMTECCT